MQKHKSSTRPGGSKVMFNYSFIKQNVLVTEDGGRSYSYCMHHTNYGEDRRLLSSKLHIICLSNLPILSVPDEGYSRNAPWVLNLISTFLFSRWVLFYLTFSFYESISKMKINWISEWEIVIQCEVSKMLATSWREWVPFDEMMMFVFVIDQHV